MLGLLLKDVDLLQIRGLRVSAYLRGSVERPRETPGRFASSR